MFIGHDHDYMMVIVILWSLSWSQLIYKGKCKFIKKDDCGYSDDVTFDKKKVAKERVETNKVKIS